MTEEFKPGDRIRKADATPDSIPAYRNMRGTVVDVIGVPPHKTMVRVQWDCDAKRANNEGTVMQYAEWITKEGA